MTARSWLVAVILLAHSAFCATSAEAQRSGFIIGFGLGPGGFSEGRTTAEYGITDRESQLGLAANFHIGAVIGQALELYLFTHEVFWRPTTEQESRYESVGVSGIGLTYPVHPDVSIKGAVGRASRDRMYSNGSNFNVWDGLGFLVGGRYGLNDRWALDLDITRASWNSGGIPSTDYGVWVGGFTLNVLSH